MSHHDGYQDSDELPRSSKLAAPVVGGALREHQSSQ
jgi:hypothetical protein